MFVPPGPELLAGIPDALLVAPPRRDSPRVPIRVGDRTSQRAIAIARHALTQGDCTRVWRALADLAPDHPDRDYVAYLHSWCERLHGDQVTAYTRLAELTVTARDDQLAPFLADELIELLASEALGEVMRATLEHAHLWHAPYVDRLAASLFARGRDLEGRFVIASTDDAPESADLLCRTIVAQCRTQLARHAPWSMTFETCTGASHIQESQACSRWRTAAIAHTLLAWNGTMAPALAGEIATAAQALREAMPALRDRIDLVLLTMTWNSEDRAPSSWDAIARHAMELARGATDRAVEPAALELARGARANERALVVAADCARQARGY